MPTSIHIITVGFDDVSRILPMGHVPQISEIYIVRNLVASQNYGISKIYDSQVDAIRKVAVDIPCKVFEVPYFDFKAAFKEAIRIIEAMPITMPNIVSKDRDL